MRKSRANGVAKPAKPTTRCAIYTRKSSEEGLEQEFNSLDAQREAAEAFIASQKAEGWTALLDRYDDGGYSGGSMERPALDRLLRDIDAGKIDCVVVYKVDRLSRSLMDFARIMQVFEAKQVSFVSVTQQFNTSHSMGRLLRCKCCGVAMSHTFTGKTGRTFYRYYRCTHAIKNGVDVCSAGMLPAGEIERVVVDEIRGLAHDEALLAQVLADARAAIQGELVAARRDLDNLRRERDRNDRELRQLATSGHTDAEVTTRIADLHARLADADRHLPELEARVAELETQTVTQADARAAFADFDKLWKSLIPREQARLLKLLISSVDYDGDAGTISVTFRPTSIRSLIDRRLEEAA